MAQRTWPLCLAVGVLLVLTTSAHAGHDDQARALFEQGKAAYELGRFEDAYGRFREAFLASHVPALRYNMASALEKLGRPHDAADELRSFLLLRPDEPERLAIESRIRGLEETQASLDAERLKREPPRLLDLREPPRAADRRRTIAIVAGSVAGVLVVGGVTLGLVFGLRQHVPETTLGNWQATP